ncbi:N-acyl-D-glucosamine 2-epimerase [Paenibacillus harenae]|uniref:N-acyl-D-glucosamine 2-epimerase n=1 Tax=Paenibacillus harenae TaxID=306543 RepID=UPI00278E4D68|nr:N-acyl-D-glucosamine 2-epimerase [Paenibacillus harenae]MDQ0059302.1 hypothetical protein [Paenibacillus harenae]
MSVWMDEGLRRRALAGPGIQIDPTFAYYRNRTAESIASEIELAGFCCVHYFVVNEHVVDASLIEAFRQRGIPVWAMVIGNGTFSTERYPEEWPSWQMKLLKETNDGFRRLSPFSEGYVRWKKAAMARLVSDYPFDGIEIAEPYFPEWGGIERGVYGDVGPLAEAAFLAEHGVRMPDFENPESERYYAKDPVTYRKWVDFRVEAVNGFIGEMINGKGGVREARPDIMVATWSLAINAGTESVERLRDDQGLDAPSMIEHARSDIHYLQTHWPDWTRGDLPGDYAKEYKPFVDHIRSLHPRIPLGIQADVGSARHMIKGGDWLSAFSQTAFGLGYSAWTAYEYHTGGYMYEAKPAPMRVERLSASEVRLTFNKRIEINPALADESFTIRRDERASKPGWDSVAVDGNRILLTSRQLPVTAFELELSGIRDTPERWLFPEKPANTVAAGTRVTVPGAWRG